MPRYGGQGQCGAPEWWDGGEDRGQRVGHVDAGDESSRAMSAVFKYMTAFQYVLGTMTQVEFE